MQHRAHGAQQLAFLHRELLVVRDAAHQAFDEHLLGERPQVRQARERVGERLRPLRDLRGMAGRCSGSTTEMPAS